MQIWSHTSHPPVRKWRSAAAVAGFQDCCGDVHVHCFTDAFTLEKVRPEKISVCLFFLTDNTADIYSGAVLDYYFRCQAGYF